MLTENQKLNIITLALAAFKNQYNIEFSPADFDLYIEKPNYESLCSMYIISKRTDDHFRIKLYLMGFTRFDNVTSYQFTQEQNYSPGYNDEIQIAGIYLNTLDYKSFQQYLLSNQFKDDVLNATNYILTEDGTGRILLENGGFILQEI